jgi:hypothetical protein
MGFVPPEVPIKGDKGPKVGQKILNLTIMSTYYEK